MLKNRAGRFVYALLIAALLLIIGRNLYHRPLNNRLIAAVQAGNLAAVRDLLARGADASTRLPAPRGAKQGMSILEQAVNYTAYSSEQSQIACLLIQHGALKDADATQINGYLVTACRSGSPALVRLLLEHGANVNASGPVGNSAVEQAIVYAAHVTNLSLDPVTERREAQRLQAEADKKRQLSVSQEIVRLLKEHGAHLTLWQAARIDDVDALRAALAAGAPIESREPSAAWVTMAGKTSAAQGPTVLTVAVQAGSLNVARVLLERGANVNVVGDYSSLLNVAITRQHLEIARLLLQWGADVKRKANSPVNTFYSPLIAACGSLPQLVPELLQRGADVKADGGSALSAAIRGRHPELVQLLLQHGASVRGRAGYDVLDAAIQQQPELVLFFLAQGADAHETGGANRLISEAVTHGRTSLIVPLLRAGANIQFHTMYGAFGPPGGIQPMYDTPLIEALGQEPEMTRVLLEHGADPNMPNSQGVTPLLAAAQSGKLEATRLLLARGAKVDEAGKMRHTPLYYARRHKHADVAALLQQAGGHEQ